MEATMFKRKLIGEGSFSKAYQVGENTVELVSICPAKECYALFSEGNPFAPKMERDYDKENTFLMPLYPKVTAPSKQLKARALTIYQALRKFPPGRDYFEFCQDVNALEVLTEEEKEDICSLAGDVCNAIDTLEMRFEISPRNISHDSEGNLIMLDCFFCCKALKAVWDSKKRR